MFLQLCVFTMINYQRQSFNNLTMLSCSPAPMLRPLAGDNALRPTVLSIAAEMSNGPKSIASYVSPNGLDLHTSEG
jgi:hypothetical protein